MRRLQNSFEFSRTLLVLLCALVAVLTFAVHTVRADDINVSAVVPAPIPSGVPVFTAPPDGTVTENPEVTFEGTCPVVTPAVIIVLYDGPDVLGSTPCLADGTFRLTATLREGTRVIVATVMTITGGVGQSSAPLHVTYQPRSNAPGVPGGTIGPTAPSLPEALEIHSEKPFLFYTVNRPVNWNGRFSGGTPPYTIIISWGDDETTTRLGVGTNPVSFPHTYRELRQYTVSVTVTDKNGLSLTRYYAAIPGGTPAPETYIPETTSTRATSYGLDYVYPLFIGLVISLAALWLYQIIRYGWLHHKKQR